MEEVKNQMKIEVNIDAETFTAHMDDIFNGLSEEQKNAMLQTCFEKHLTEHPEIIENLILIRRYEGAQYSQNAKIIYEPSPFFKDYLTKIIDNLELDKVGIVLADQISILLMENGTAYTEEILINVITDTINHAFTQQLASSVQAITHVLTDSLMATNGKFGYHVQNHFAHQHSYNSSEDIGIGNNAAAASMMSDTLMKSYPTKN